MSCCGLGKDDFFAGLNGPAPEGEHRVRGFDASVFFDAKEARRADPFAQFAVAAADMALLDAGPVDVDPALAGVQIGTGVGGLSTHGDPDRRSLGKRTTPCVTVPRPDDDGQCRRGDGVDAPRMARPCETIATACASGTHAILAAHRLIASGRCDAVLAGGAEAAMTPVALAAFGNMTALSTSGQSRPFDVRRDGFVIAEGGAVLVLEELERARARGAHIYAELLGGASTADAHHITAPAPGGVGAIGCMELALEDAGLAAGDVAHVNAHGTSTPLNDLAEAEAIEKIFGRPGPARHLDKGRNRALARSGGCHRSRRLCDLDRTAAHPSDGGARAA